MGVDEQVRIIASLSDDTRRALYLHVRNARRPVTREEAAGAVRVSPKLAAFHLDKLVDHGLLEAGRRKPGGVMRRVGRAPKTYSPSDIEVSLTLPERRYQLAGEILVDALTRPVSAPSAACDAAREVAHERGRHIGEQARAATRSAGRPGPERTVAMADRILADYGFEPADDGGGGLVLRNCPFHGLVDRAPELVCSLNAALIDGMLRGLGNDSVKAELDPCPPLCCVRVRPPGR